MNRHLFLTSAVAVIASTAAFAQSSSTPRSSNSSTQVEQGAAARSDNPPASNDSTTPRSSTRSGAGQNAQSDQPSTSNQGTTPAQSSSSSHNDTQTNSAPANHTQPRASEENNRNDARSGDSDRHTTRDSDRDAARNSENSRASERESERNTSRQSDRDRDTAREPDRDRATNRDSGTDHSTARDSHRNTPERAGGNERVNLNEQQRTRVSQTLGKLDVRPITNVNFSLSVGTRVPRDIRLSPLPNDVIEIVPQYRGYDFVLVRDEIVIVDPSNYEIVAVLPHSGRANATGSAVREHRKMTFSDRDRAAIRKHVHSRTAERPATTTVTTEIRAGERVPEGVEVEAFPEEVYRDAPDLREYRYIYRDNHTYVVEPEERRVIEEID
jgi:hypothetical protein